MKTTKKSALRRILMVTCFALTSEAMAQNNIGVLDDRSRGGGYRAQNGWGVYTVLPDSSTDRHDPRVERRINDKIYSRRGDYNFYARYNILSAKATTIAQILNFDRNATNRYKPQVFTNARGDGNQWAIVHRGTVVHRLGKNTSRRTPSFRLRLRTNNRRTFLYINGTRKLTVNHAREGTNSQMRYGAYHHGDNTARIRVKDVVFRKP